MKIKYWLLNFLLFVGLFTLVIPTVYHVTTGHGWAYLFHKVQVKYHPQAKRKIADFFKPWY